MIIRADDIPEKEIQFSAMRASGPGGQHVNKTSNAVHLKFDILSSSLPRKVKDELLGLKIRGLQVQVFWLSRLVPSAVKKKIEATRLIVWTSCWPRRKKRKKREKKRGLR